MGWKKPPEQLEKEIQQVSNLVAIGKSIAEAAKILGWSRPKAATIIREHTLGVNRIRLNYKKEQENLL